MGSVAGPGVRWYYSGSRKSAWPDMIKGSLPATIYPISRIANLH